MVAQAGLRPLNITENLIARCCRGQTQAALMVPDSLSIHAVRFVETRDSGILFDFIDPASAEVPVGAVACVHFRFDNASRLLQCRVIEASSQILLEITSDCVTRDQREEFRVPVRDQAGLAFEVSHKETGTCQGKLRNLSHSGCLADIARSTTKQWHVGDLLLLRIELNGKTCELDGRVNRVSDYVGIELLDPISHTVPDCDDLRSIVAGLERRFLRNRIRV